MARPVVCDLCGKTPANRLELGIVFTGVAAPDKPTGATEAVDSCMDCQEDAIDLLCLHVRETLREQVPFHARLEEQNAIIEAAQTDLAETRRLMLAHEEAYADAEVVPDVPKEIRVPHEAKLLEVADAEVARVEILTEAKTVHDKRINGFRKSLTKGKPAKRKR